MWQVRVQHQVIDSFDFAVQFQLSVINSPLEIINHIIIKSKWICKTLQSDSLVTLIFLPHNRAFVPKYSMASTKKGFLRFYCLCVQWSDRSLDGEAWGVLKTLTGWNRRFVSEGEEECGGDDWFHHHDISNQWSTHVEDLWRWRKLHCLFYCLFWEWSWEFL